MKLLIHSKDKDTNPKLVKSFGDLSTVLLLTYEDIHSDTNLVVNTRGYLFTTVLIPEIFKEDEKHILEETYLWNTIRPALYNGGRQISKIIYY